MPLSPAATRLWRSSPSVLSHAASSHAIETANPQFELEPLSRGTRSRSKRARNPASEREMGEGRFGEERSQRESTGIERRLSFCLAHRSPLSLSPPPLRLLSQRLLTSASRYESTQALPPETESISPYPKKKEDKGERSRKWNEREKQTLLLLLPRSLLVPQRPRALARSQAVAAPLVRRLLSKTSREREKGKKNKGPLEKVSSAKLDC